jgi:hypothetical protein
LDTSSLVNAGKLRADGNDLRILWNNGSSLTQLDRVAETSFNSGSTELWFRTQSAITANSADSNYYLYYGNPAAGTAPVNRSNIYSLWDDFTGTNLNTTTWNATGGVSLSNGQAYLPVGANLISQTAYTSSVIEMRVQLAAENDYAWWGWEQSQSNASNFLVFEETSSVFYAWQRTNWTDTYSTVTKPSGGLSPWRTYTINWLPSSVRWSIDGSQVASIISGVPTAAMYANVYAFSVPMYLDWVKVRPVVAVEPTVSGCSGVTLPTSAPAATFTPTPISIPTVTPTASLIFADGFETGNMAAWTASTTDNGSLTVSASAALNGSYGLQGVINDNNAIYVTDDAPASETHYRASFLFDPNSIVMANSNAHYIFYGYTGTSTVVLRLELLYSSGTYNLRGSVSDNSTTFTNTNSFVVSDAPHKIELDWRAASASGANDGRLTIWMDGVQQVSLTNINNNLRRIDRVRLGPVAGIDTGTRGTYYFDAFESYR